MSAGVLREAAKEIRAEWSGGSTIGTEWQREQAFHLAVADWLVGEAIAPSDWNLAAFAAARAYLGEVPR